MIEVHGGPRGSGCSFCLPLLMGSSRPPSSHLMQSFCKDTARAEAAFLQILISPELLSVSLGRTRGVAEWIPSEGQEKLSRVAC